MQHEVVSPKEWLAARIDLLRKEKELTRSRDRLNAERRNLPWVRIDKTYEFEGPNGNETLADLFDGRSQLIIKHFMFGPDWQEGCVGCSFGADNVHGVLVHLAHHDVSYAAVSRAPLAKIESFKRRMGWNFRWVTSAGNDFNFDFHVSFTPAEIAGGAAWYNYTMQPVPSEEMTGFSVFYKDEAGAIFHTYSTYARGTESFLSAYALLDVTPKGRNEAVSGNLTDWVRHHDRYGDGGPVAPAGQ
jgi:predicted dithiol-disulfide oxidoreductase (DUF899 family)